MYSRPCPPAVAKQLNAAVARPGKSEECPDRHATMAAKQSDTTKSSRRTVREGVTFTQARASQRRACISALREDRSSSPEPVATHCNAVQRPKQQCLSEHCHRSQYKANQSPPKANTSLRAARQGNLSSRWQAWEAGTRPHLWRTAALQLG